MAYSDNGNEMLNKLKGMTPSLKAEPKTEPQEEQNLLGIGGIVRPAQKKEVKSKRVNLVIKPSLLEQATKKCKKQGFSSFNELMNQLLEAYIKG